MNLEEHCKHSLDSVGIEGRAIHSWMDEPCKLFGPSHRKVRHNLEGLNEAIRIFNDKFSEGKITEVFVDHVSVDLIGEPHYPKDKDNQAVEEIEDNKNLRELDNELKLTKLKTRNIRDYLRIAFLNNPKKQKQFNNAYYALADWDKFYSDRDNASAALATKDIHKYALSLRDRRLSPKSASSYLLYLKGYFKQNSKANYKIATEQYRIFVGEINDDNKTKIPIKYAWNLFKHADDVEDQVLIRLLIFNTTIPINDFENLKFKRFDGGYEFRLLGTEIAIDEETVKIAEPMLKENAQKKSVSLFSISNRTMEDRIHKLRRHIGIKDKIRLQDLRDFGERQNKEEMLALFRQNELKFAH